MDKDNWSETCCTQLYSRLSFNSLSSKPLWVVSVNRGCTSVDIQLSTSGCRLWSAFYRGCWNGSLTSINQYFIQDLRWGRGSGRWEFLFLFLAHKLASCIHICMADQRIPCLGQATFGTSFLVNNRRPSPKTTPPLLCCFQCKNIYTHNPTCQHCFLQSKVSTWLVYMCGGWLVYMCEGLPSCLLKANMKEVPTLRFFVWSQQLWVALTRLNFNYLNVTFNCMY